MTGHDQDPDDPVIAGGWLDEPALRAVLAALGGGTVDGDAARLVGGCVRNALLDQPINDIDIATPLTPDAVVARLETADIKAVPTGLEHGTITAVVDGKGFEVTTLRRDVETDGRHAVVSFTTDWSEDAARRDFTMNALYALPSGEVIDLVGGVSDARAGRVRFVGEPERRIAEDYLRVLRFFRFFAWYGRETPDEATLAALAAGAPGMERLAAERVRMEMLKLLSGPMGGPSGGVETAWRMMVDTGVAERCLGTAGNVERLAGLARTGHDRPDALLRLSALVADPEVPHAEVVAERLRLSKAERRRLYGIEQALIDAPFAALDTDFAREKAYWHGVDIMLDALIVFAAGGGIGPVGLEALDGWQPPPFPIGGAEAAAAGIPEGPEIGAALSATEQWWAAGGFAADRQACIDFMRGFTGLPPDPNSSPGR